MDPSQRGALMLVRVIAVSLIGWSVVNFALYSALAQSGHDHWGILASIVKALPAVLGVIMLLKGRALAEWIADLLDN